MPPDDGSPVQALLRDILPLLSGLTRVAERAVAPPGCRKPARTVQKKNRTGGPVIYPQKLGIQSVRIPARSRTAATCRRLPRANHHPVNPQQAAEPIGAS